ncbi:MAG: RNA polymerase sigma factor [Ferruginibacter sp.]|nr:RNA polymerase sigma factor [Cytophagales bacterium]
MSLEEFQKRVLPVKNKLFRFAVRLTGNPEDAEDIVQEVLIRVWNRRQEVDTYRNVEAWCMRLVKNRFLDGVKSKRHRTTGRMAEDEDVPVHTHTPYQVTELNDTMQQVNRLIEALPLRQKQVIHLRDVEGYPYQEIAEMLEMDLNQVKVNLFRARTAIRKRLTDAENYGLE